MTLILLFAEFLKTGLFAVGGGMATIPFLYDMADKYPWFTRETIADMVAIAESTPGPIGVNMATYAGYTTAGLLGGIVATAGLVLPSFVIIMIIAGMLKKFGNSFYVKSAFYGIRPAVAALIAVAGFEIFKVSLLTLDIYTDTGSVLSLFDFKSLILAAVVLVMLFKTKIHPIIFILAGAIIGIVFKF